MSVEMDASIDDPRVQKLRLHAHILLERGDVLGCISIYQQALSLAFSSPMLHAGLAAVLEHCGDLNGSREEYSKARQLDPSNAEYQEALDSLQARIGKTPTRPLAGTMTAPLDGKAPPAPEPIPAALVAVARAVRSNEVSPEDRGWVIAALRIAVKNEPDNERLHIKLSNLLQSEGDRLGAIHHMREANRLNRTQLRRRA